MKTNVPTMIKDGDLILKMSGKFGATKTVNINSFGGQTYIHLRSPSGIEGATGWNTYSMNLSEWTQLVNLLNAEELLRIEEAFQTQVQNKFFL